MLEQSLRHRIVAVNVGSDWGVGVAMADAIPHSWVVANEASLV